MAYGLIDVYFQTSDIALGFIQLQLQLQYYF